MTTKELKVNFEDEGKRLDKFLVDNFSDFTRNQLAQMIISGDVLIGGKKTKTSHKVHLDDVVKIGKIKTKKNLSKPKGEKISLNIIYENDDVIVVNKEAGIVVHPADGNESGTLVNALINYYPKIVGAIYDEDSEISKIRPGIVHRLDKETTGVMIVAKNKESLMFLSNEIQKRKVEKKYLAVCLDNFPNKRGEVVSNIVRHPKNRKKMTSHSGEKGKEAKTLYKVQKTYKYDNQNTSLVEFHILTGRTHQIRVHAKSLNSPVIGDRIYNTKPSISLSKKLNTNRALLHSHLLKIRLPNKKEMTFEAKMPSDFEALIKQIS